MKRKKIKIPKGLTEQEVLRVIDNVANRLAYRFKFGYHEVDDMKQQAALYAWEGLEHYDGKRPLENFLWVHTRNRLFNFKRDQYERPDKPCYDCPLKAYNADKDECLAYNDKLDCNFYSKWLSRNNCRKNVLMPIELSEVSDDHEDNMKIFEDASEIINKKEIVELLDMNIPVELGGDYLRLKQGAKLSRSKLVKLQDVIWSILAEHNVDLDYVW